MTDQAWETLSNQAIAAAGVVYFLSLLVLPRAVGLAAQRPGRAYAGQGRRRCGRGLDTPLVPRDGSTGEPTRSSRGGPR